MNFKEYYINYLIKKKYYFDSSQIKVINYLQLIYEKWIKYNKNFFKKIILRKKVPQGIYLWGDVGRGKSDIMNFFYSMIPFEKKIRFHFYEWIKNIHYELHKSKNLSNPLDNIALKVSKKYWLIYLDEFHISDTANAIIFFNFFKKLLYNNVYIIMTSNYDPNLLYSNNLHNNHILPIIKLLKEKMDIVNINGNTDYRFLSKKNSHYYAPINTLNNNKLLYLFNKIKKKSKENSYIYVTGNRKIYTVRCSKDIIWFDFFTLCKGTYSQNDYLYIVNNFKNIILSNVPCMSIDMSLEARRFTWLIDIFYEYKIKLIILAEVEPVKLYTKGPLLNEFKRTVSRIMEMQYFYSEK
ncbi:cell division protein ZapE [Candidatus Profftella armatura]|uniref:cell division protein ZapE n=1 Tax=Candidatus Profftella armatura TaxID=669502 RepID=UPI0015DBEA2C|nr:cell division protein ZapE [Candidatus Profftella armatura]QLK13694.1 cell division protein ZapE [Candidatus Profftella armatura]